MKRNNKGQLGSLQSIIATIIAIAILIVVGLLIVQEFFDQEEFADTAYTVSLESGAYINGTTYTVSDATRPGFNSFSVSSIVNASNGGTIDASNYTVNADLGTIIGTAARAENYTVNVTYSYLYGEESWIGVNDTLGAMKTIPDLLPLVILIIMIGVIMAIILTVIPGARMGA